MIRKIDVLLPQLSQYEVIHHFTEKIYEAFLRAGIKTRLLKQWHFEESFRKSPPDLTVGFNGAPFNENDELLCDIYKIPHLSLLLDPPYRFPYLIDSPFITIGCDDAACCTMIRAKGFEKTFFLPHGVEPELAPDPKIEKIYDTVMLATFVDFEQIRADWTSKYDKEIVKALHAAAEETFSDPYKSFITAFQDAYQGLFDWVKLSDPLQELELYVKGKDRALLAQSYDRATLHIFGGSFGKKGWKEYLGKKHPAIYVHNPVSFLEAIEIMKRTKILLNPSLKNKEGAHERIFTGMAAGALVVTAESRFLRETFSEGDGLVYYSHTKLKELRETIKSYIGDDEMRSEAILKGYAIIQKNHTWDQRVAQILKNIY